MVCQSCTTPNHSRDTCEYPVSCTCQHVQRQAQDLVVDGVALTTGETLVLATSMEPNGVYQLAEVKDGQ